MTQKEIKKLISSLENIKEIQCSEGNYNVNEYMRGLANGLISAESIMKDKPGHHTPEFK